MSLCQLQTGMFRCRSFKNIAKTLEFFFAVMFLYRLVSCSSFYFPAAVESCTVLFRRLCVVLVSNRFMFFLGNLIVLTLFVKSGGSTKCAASDEEDYLIGQFGPPSVVETVSDEKRMVGPTEIEVCSEVRVKRRTLSEDFKPEVTEKLQLRRSETEADLKKERSGEESTGRKMTVEDLSNEEFQRKVEAFIEQQQRFLREESLSML